MEAHSLLKYWRSGGDGGGGGCPTRVVEQDSAPTPTIVTATMSPCSSDGEDGPYFDLEFTLPEDETDAEEDETTSKCSGNDYTITENGDGTEDGSRAEEESEHENGVDPKFTVESSSILLNVSEETSYSFPVSLLKSATKIRVLLLKFKRSKSGKSENNETFGRENAESVKIQENHCTKTSGKFFTVKFKVEEVKAPLISLFTRDHNPKEKQGKGIKDNEENLDFSRVSDDKKLIQKYLKMVKPLYIRVSKRYVEKLKFSVQLSFSGSKSGSAASSPPCVAAMVEEPGAAEAVDATRIAQVNGVQTAGPKVMHKQLGKIRSASATSPPVKMAASDRRDDSLLQVQDGIQDAILHCKRSFQRL
ncbi:probable membrane-associated kinase regulator 2 [Primulina huaijiensis]|uniref:probable membrane-associated kinase regulator 2 n=1 Tax=Primulina huaijiensis TaxID=1492673 RepID=UPI003CC75991